MQQLGGRKGAIYSIQPLASRRMKDHSRNAALWPLHDKIWHAAASVLPRNQHHPCSGLTDEPHHRPPPSTAYILRSATTKTSLGPPPLAREYGNGARPSCPHLQWTGAATIADTDGREDLDQRFFRSGLVASRYACVSDVGGN
jgi:hypothetical protein